jgi:uncharacterized membrane protein (UPF0127 family)
MGGRKKMMATLFLGIAIVVLACAASYFIFIHKANPPLKQNEVRVGDAVFTVEIASSTVEKARGLSFRDGLADGHGMLFLFSSGIQSFWMKDMRFSIDMIWIGGGKVIGFSENVAPQPGAAVWELKIYNSPDGTDKVLEVPAGAVAKDHIKTGDPVQVGI